MALVRFEFGTSLVRLSNRVLCRHDNFIFLRSYRTIGPSFGFPPEPLKTRTADIAVNTQGKKVELPEEVNIQALVNHYRQYGHLRAQVDPLEEDKQRQPIKLLEDFALNGKENAAAALETTSPHLVDGVENVAALEDRLDNIYCQKLTLEVGHLVDQREKDWICSEFERISSQPIDDESRRQAALLMKKSQVFENFLATKFPTVKRYGGDGCQALMALFNQLFKSSAYGGVERVVMGMPHRGRLNLQTSLLNFPPVEMFQKMSGMREWPDDVTGSGDILSHLSNSCTLEYGSHHLQVSMIPNPSHLEAASPVAVGKTRAKQRMCNDGDYRSESCPMPYKTMCVQVHGDASFAGQGVIQETLALAQVPHFNVGGSVHVIVNNQLGFTTEAERGRSSSYTSCVSKMNSLPILHVNGEDPDAVMKAITVAVLYRNAWKKDITVDMVCYRRYGHNELDNPSFTQPLMYRVIDSLPPLPDRYTSQLIAEGVCSDVDIAKPVEEWAKYLQQQYESQKTSPPRADHLTQHWAGMVQPSKDLSCWDTGVEGDLLRFVAASSVSVPDDLPVHPTLEKSHIERRLARNVANDPVDWATAEALAFGTALCQGFDVRISGQDVGRGTFSHRHLMLVDQDTDHAYIPLNNMFEEQKNFIEVCNSILSEEAVLGFEYGFSIESPRCLNIWEAQFGDFFNGAQIMIDTYVSSGEAKWLRQSGLVMLLPTGMDGAGPEHSSCRLERFLQLTDSQENGVDGDMVNMSVVHPTTPAQYFHLLRRQVVRNFRKPLIVASPKVLLRHPAAVSSLNEMTMGTSFSPVLDDSSVTKANVSKLIFCSGQHFYSLQAEKERRNLTDTALVRLEELCPFPTLTLQQLMATYPSAKCFIWAQEEHRNYGAWSFVRPRFESMLGCKLDYAGRGELAAPATGVGKEHKAECAAILDAAFT